MKSLSLGIILIAATASFADGPPLQNFCSPFNGQNCEVIWGAPTNNLPASVKVFRVVPREFSAATVSNLLTLTGLNEKNKKRPLQEGVFSGRGVLTFANREDTDHLDVVPSQGFIVLVKDGVIAGGREKPDGVPDDAEALRLTSDLLTKLGLSRTELAVEADGSIRPLAFSEGSEIFREKPSGNIVTNITSRRVSLGRQIEGIPVWGPAGISARYGNQGKLAQLTVTWRNTGQGTTLPVPTSSEFIDRIKSGRTLIRSGERSDFKKLTVKKASLYYWESEGTEMQNSIYPFAVLEAETDLNSKVELFVPFANE